eukprot:1189209-Prorocentrum_minimum.AAC.5
MPEKKRTHLILPTRARLLKCAFREKVTPSHPTRVGTLTIRAVASLVSTEKRRHVADTHTMPITAGGGPVRLLGGG